jgi:hypothetical protein
VSVRDSKDNDKRKNSAVKRQIWIVHSWHILLLTNRQNKTVSLWTKHWLSPFCLFCNAILYPPILFLRLHLHRNNVSRNAHLLLNGWGLQWRQQNSSTVNKRDLPQLRVNTNHTSHCTKLCCRETCSAESWSGSINGIKLPLCLSN